MTLEEIRRCEKAVLVPTDVAKILGISAYSITLQVREDKRTGQNSFPFPTIKAGTRTLIPRIPFLEAIEGKIKKE